jgi:putative addiction module component (TIGR02574 family)
MTTAQEILGAVMALQDDERLLVVEQLLEQLSPESEELTDDQLAAELEHRKSDFERGTADAISWPELRDEDPKP